MRLKSLPQGYALTWQQRQGYSSHVQQPPHHQSALSGVWQPQTSPAAAQTQHMAQAGSDASLRSVTNLQTHVSRGKLLTMHLQTSLSRRCSANQRVLSASGEDVSIAVRVSVSHPPRTSPSQTEIFPVPGSHHHFSLREASATWGTFTNMTQNTVKVYVPVTAAECWADRRTGDLQGCWKHPGRTQQRMHWHAQSHGNQTTARAWRTCLQVQEETNPLVLQHNTPCAQENQVRTKTGCTVHSSDLRVTALPQGRLRWEGAG